MLSVELHFDKCADHIPQHSNRLWERRDDSQTRLQFLSGFVFVSPYRRKTTILSVHLTDLGQLVLGDMQSFGLGIVSVLGKAMGRADKIC